jgi:hypothetical protein
MAKYTIPPHVYADCRCGNFSEETVVKLVEDALAGDTTGKQPTKKARHLPTPSCDALRLLAKSGATLSSRFHRLVVRRLLEEKLIEEFVGPDSGLPYVRATDLGHMYLKVRDFRIKA